MSIEWMPTTGPWFMTYSPGSGTLGVMLSAGGSDITLSGGVGRFGLVVGWRARRHTFRNRRYVLGRER